jgi:hypothetical protein
MPLGIDEAPRRNVPFAVGLLHEFFDVAEIIGVHDEQAKLEIESAARPFRSAFAAREAIDAVIGGNGFKALGTGEVIFVDHRLADRTVFRRQVGDFIQAQTGSCQLRRLVGNGLGRPGGLAGQR